MDSILTSIKKLLGIQEDYTHFDSDIIMHINSVFTILTQLGIGPENGFSISDKYTTWDQFLENDLRLESVKSYMFMKVKLLFDPPDKSSVMEATTRMIDELEWRLTITHDEMNREKIQNG